MEGLEKLPSWANHVEMFGVESILWVASGFCHSKKIIVVDMKYVKWLRTCILDPEYHDSRAGCITIKLGDSGEFVSPSVS
jgi:hypothetical protein